MAIVVVFNTGAAGSVKPPLFLQGLEVSFATLASVSVAAGQARDDTDAANLVLAAPATADFAVSGPGGLQTGQEQDHHRWDGESWILVPNVPTPGSQFPYMPNDPADWSGAPPITVAEALDRIAAALGPIA